MFDTSRETANVSKNIRHLAVIPEVVRIFLTANPRSIAGLKICRQGTIEPAPPSL
jgi:hypothetical protein